MRLLDLIQEHGVPFMIAGAAGMSVNKTRLAESVITAVVSGGVIAVGGYFVALPVLQEQMNGVRSQIVEVKADIREIKADIKDASDKLDTRLRTVEINQGKVNGPH